MCLWQHSAKYRGQASVASNQDKQSKHCSKIYIQGLSWVLEENMTDMMGGRFQPWSSTTKGCGMVQSNGERGKVDKISWPFLVSKANTGTLYIGGHNRHRQGYEEMIQDRMDTKWRRIGSGIIHFFLKQSKSGHKVSGLDIMALPPFHITLFFSKVVYQTAQGICPYWLHFTDRPHDQTDYGI